MFRAAASRKTSSSMRAASATRLYARQRWPLPAASCVISGSGLPPGSGGEGGIPEMSGARAGRAVAALLGLLLGGVAPAAADIAVSPPSAALAPGEESSVFQISVTNAVPTTGPAALAVSGLPPGASTRPSPVSVLLSRSGTGSGSFRVSTSPLTPPGEYLVSLSGPAGLGIGSTTLRLTVLAPGVSLAPASLVLTAGAASPPLTLRVSNVAAAEVAFTASLPPALVGHVSLEPHPVRVPIEPSARAGSATFRLLSARRTPPGTHVVTLRDAVYGLAASLTLVVQPALEIRSVAPAALATESLDVALRLSGEGFEPGARLVADDPTLVFGAVQVLSEGLALASVSVRSDAAPGPHEVRLVNPDGTAASTRLTIVPADALAAPFAVRTVAIVSPSPGSLLGADEALRPRGVLAVSGTGLVVGTWQLDGVPFERFTVSARGGLPVSVEAAMPIPRTAPGEHRLQLAIETPQRLASEPVPLVQVLRRESRLRLLSPRDGAVLAAPPFALRWSAVPGIEGYEVEIDPGGGRLPLQLTTAVPQLEPPAGALRPGVHRWRVRPLLPGGVRGEPTPARRIAVLPEAVKLRLVPAASGGTSSLRWEGGVPGLLYRVELLDADGGPARFAALTIEPSYRLPAAWRARAKPLLARVSAIAPGARELGRSAAIELRPAAGEAAFAAAQPAVSVRNRRPAAASPVGTAHPKIAAEWDEALAPEAVTLVVDDVDVTALARVSERAIEYDSLLPLAPGEHAVSLVLGGTLERWSFKVAPGTPAPKEKPSSWASEPASESRWGDWRLAVDGTLTFVTGDLGEDAWTARGALSGQVDVDRPGAFVRGAGDLSAATGDAPDGASASSLENRNWTLSGGPRQGRIREEATVGYTPPAFLSGSELMSAGLARGGVQGAIAGPAVELAYYETFDSDFAGVATGSYAPAQRLRAAGLTLGRQQGKYSLRLLGLETEEDPGVLSAGGEGRVYGLVGTYRPHPAWTLLVEAARGEFEPSASSYGAPREGYALRLGVHGTAGGWGARLSLRDTDPGFVNPANRGLTPGGVSDRTGGDLELTRAFGRSVLRLAYAHLEGGGGLGLAAAEGRQDSGQAQLTLALGSAVSASLAGSLTATRSEGDLQLGLPESDQTDKTLHVQLTETLGGFSLGQNASYLSSEDRLDPTRRSEVTTGGVTLAGQVANGFSLFAQATGTRVEGDPAFGRTDSLLVALQPALVASRAGLSLLPYVSWSRTENDTLATWSEVASYQVTLLWNPRLWRSLFTLQASADWTRTTAGDQPGAGFLARYTFALSLRRDAGSGGAPRPVLPPPAGPRPPGAPPGQPPGLGTTIS